VERDEKERIKTKEARVKSKLFETKFDYKDYK